MIICHLICLYTRMVVVSWVCKDKTHIHEKKHFFFLMLIKLAFDDICILLHDCMHDLSICWLLRTWKAHISVSILWIISRNGDLDKSNKECKYLMCLKIGNPKLCLPNYMVLTLVLKLQTIWYKPGRLF